MANYVIIPAHCESSRLPDKLLLSETGKPLIRHTWENCIRLRQAEVFIATDSEEICKVCQGFGANVIYSITPSSCGTQRVVQAFLEDISCGPLNRVTKLQKAARCDETDVVVNVQAEWPTIDPDGIRRIMRDTAEQRVPSMASLYYKAPANDDPNLVKVVLGDRRNCRNDVNVPQRAIYFSRSPVPHGATEFNYHVGAYALNRRMAEEFYSLAMKSDSYHVDSEKLEQLRVLIYDYPIWMFETKPTIGIDTRELYDRFKCELRQAPDSRAQAGYFS